MPRIALCGWLMIGVPWNVPNPPGFVIVNVPPWTSSGMSFFVRARSARSATPRAMPSRFMPSTFLSTGTMRPLPPSSETAKPRFTKLLVTIEAPRISALTQGQSRIVSTVARATNERYVGLTP